MAMKFSKSEADLPHATIAKPTMKIVARELQSGNPDKALLLKLRARMKRFHILQFTLVAVIFFLIIFKV